MLLVRDPDRIRILTAVATRGAVWQVRRVVVITASLLVLLAVPAFGLARVDLWDGRHLLLGERVGALVALRGVVVAIAALWGVTFLTNMIVGRFFCGWGCPVGYVSRLGEEVDLKKRDRLRWLASHAAGAGFVGTFIAALMSWWVDPRVMLEGSPAAKAIVGGLWFVLCIGGFLHAFAWRFGFCRSACPIGLYYRYVTSKTPIGIVFDEQPSPCIECGACVKICPVDLDPRKLGDELTVAAAPAGALTAGLCGGGADGVAVGEGASAGSEVYGDAECIRCGDCVEACRMIFKVRPAETPPLRFGRPGRKAGSDRAGLLFLSALAVLLSTGACRSAIDDKTREDFRARLGSTSFTVYPAHLHRHDGSTFDDESAVRIAAVLNDEGYGRAVASSRHAPIDVEPGMNQLRMWRDTAAQFGAWIAVQPPETDYAILTEQLGGGDGHEIGGLHAFVVDRSGKLVDGLLLNNHHSGFAAAHAKSPAEGTEVLLTVMREDWAPYVKR